MKDDNGMKIKSYFARTVDEAISKARVELGSEALLLNTRKIADAGLASGNAPGYEVVMGVAGPAPALKATAPAPPKAEPRVSPAAAVPPKLPDERLVRAADNPQVASEIERLRAQMDELQGLLVRSANNAWAAQRSVPEVADVYARLIASEVDPALSKDIADRLEAAMATDAFFMLTGPEPAGAQNRWKTLKSDPGRVEQFLRAELESRVPLRPRLGASAQDAVCAFVGPAGSGKTTSLVKLAVAASAQRRVRIVSLDRSRNTAQALLTGIAAPGIAFSSVDSVEQLPKVVAEARKKECVLIDTPGYGSIEQPAAGRLAEVLASCTGVDVHLVTPAYMKARDLRKSIERLRLFEPAKLLVTKMDETETFGTVFSEAAFAGLALSFLSHGPRVPDNIRAASADDLLALMREQPRARAAYAVSNQTSGHKAA